MTRTCFFNRGEALLNGSRARTTAPGCSGEHCRKITWTGTVGGATVVLRQSRTHPYRIYGTRYAHNHAESVGRAHVCRSSPVIGQTGIRDSDDLVRPHADQGRLLHACAPHWVMAECYEDGWRIDGLVELRVCPNLPPGPRRRSAFVLPVGRLDGCGVAARLVRAQEPAMRGIVVQPAPCIVLRLGIDVVTEVDDHQVAGI